MKETPNIFREMLNKCDSLNISGSIWVFSIYQDNRNCDDIIYKFTFGVLILKYIVLTFISAIVCLCCCFICFLSARMPMDAKTETAHLVSAEN
ncbi:uncharacterized protein LOC120917511 isoform X2 [Rana temporaria]|uniref:uncharacterized protein LOC120917511 isoform X2 n=1 Tax=Rana temporaria TaxID=8407 RepID=UPI001AAD5BC7|nr:uncharacterized protein LOC120917511 isoform X2 [Rana temporaria]